MDGWPEHGWFIVASSQAAKGGTYHCIKDDLILDKECDNAVQRQTVSQISQNVHVLANLINREHGYDAVSKSKDIIQELNNMACSIFHEENKTLLTNDIQEK